MTLLISEISTLMTFLVLRPSFPNALPSNPLVHYSLFNQARVMSGELRAVRNHTEHRSSFGRTAIENMLCTQLNTAHEFVFCSISLHNFALPYSPPTWRTQTPIQTTLKIIILWFYSSDGSSWYTRKFGMHIQNYTASHSKVLSVRFLSCLLLLYFEPNCIYFTVA
jgi:hypothetical protein